MQPSKEGAVPPFNPVGTLWPQDTQRGLFRHYLDVTDPRCLAPGFFFNMPLETATAMLQEHRLQASRGGGGGNDGGGGGGRTLTLTRDQNERLWLAKKIHASAVHPDTGDVIVQPFRMSGFAV